MINMSAKFDKQIQNGLVSIVFTSLFPYMSIVTLTFELWPQNGLVSIVFTSLFPYMSIVTLTFDPWPQKSIGFILLSWLTCLPSLINKYKTV